jgi:hypothetical protein
VIRPENWTTTERDAELYERHFGPDYPEPLNDRPDPSDLWDEAAERGECADEDYGDGPEDLA